MEITSNDQTLRIILDELDYDNGPFTISFYFKSIGNKCTVFSLVEEASPPVSLVSFTVEGGKFKFTSDSDTDDLNDFLNQWIHATITFSKNSRIGTNKWLIGFHLYRGSNYYFSEIEGTFTMWNPAKTYNFMFGGAFVAGVLNAGYTNNIHFRDINLYKGDQMYLLPSNCRSKVYFTNPNLNSNDHCVLCNVGKYNDEFMCENSNTCTEFADNNEECEYCPPPTEHLGGGECSLCGDGDVEGGAEVCDDGNSDNRDGCDDTCNIEANSVCNGPNTLCSCEPQPISA